MVRGSDHRGTDKGEGYEAYCFNLDCGAVRERIGDAGVCTEPSANGQPRGVARDGCSGGVACADEEASSHASPSQEVV